MTIIINKYKIRTPIDQFAARIDQFILLLFESTHFMIQYITFTFIFMNTRYMNTSTVIECSLQVLRIAVSNPDIALVHVIWHHFGDWSFWGMINYINFPKDNIVGLVLLDHYSQCHKIRSVNDLYFILYTNFWVSFGEP